MTGDNVVTTELESLVILLEDWAKWQSNCREKIGFRSRSAGFVALGLSNFDDMCFESDNSIMRTLETSIDDLEPVQAAAIYRRYGVSNVFRFPHNNYEQALVLAHERLVISCKRKGIVL